MARRRRSQTRTIAPDSVYGDEVLAKFVNCLMKDGKKSVAERLVRRAMEDVGSRGAESPLRVFREAVDRAMPALEVRSRRVGGATYQVPMEVRPERRRTLALRWLISAARERGGHDMGLRLSAELQEAAAGRGGAVRKKEEAHRMAEANKAFSHYRW